MTWPALGLHDGVPGETYHSTRLLSASGIGRLLDCPATYHHLLDHPEDDKTTKAMTRGTAFHAYILEPDTFASRFHVTPKGFKRNATVAQADDVKALLAAEAAGKKQVVADDWDTIRRVADAVRGNRAAAELLDCAAAFERSMAWQEGDGDGAVLMKGRVDIDCATACAMLVDLKMTADPRPDDWCGAAERVGCHLQAALYAMGYYEVTAGQVLPEWRWIVAPNEPPFLPERVWVGGPSERWLRRARADIARALDLYRACRAAGRWPGYMATDEDLVIEPRWLTNQKE